MATTPGKATGTSSENIKVLKIPRDILEKLEALPNSNNRKIILADWDQEAIKKYIKTKSIRNIGKALGHSANAINRYLKESKIKR